jgi:hypothetical protein
MFDPQTAFYALTPCGDRAREERQASTDERHRLTLPTLR